MRSGENIGPFTIHVVGNCTFKNVTIRVSDSALSGSADPVGLLWFTSFSDVQVLYLALRFLFVTHSRCLIH
jgi:hypothetical protein